MTLQALVIHGTICRLVTSHGSSWGKITPGEGRRDVFFNRASMTRPAEFDTLELGGCVSFEEVPDHVNGSHAVNLASAPARD